MPALAVLPPLVLVLPAVLFGPVLKPLLPPSSPDEQANKSEIAAAKHRLIDRMRCSLSETR